MKNQFVTETYHVPTCQKISEFKKVKNSFGEKHRKRKITVHILPVG